MDIGDWTTLLNTAWTLWQMSASTSGGGTERALRAGNADGFGNAIHF